MICPLCESNIRRRLMDEISYHHDREHPKINIISKRNMNRGYRL